MDHDSARELVLDDQRGRLDPAQRRDLRAHLDACPACSAHDVREAALTAALEEKLPRHAASLALRRKLSARLNLAPGGLAPRPRLLRAASLCGAAAALALLWVAVGRKPGPGLRAVAAEAVGDHLRLLDGELNLSMVTSGIHEVKPWFAGRLDFAPEHLFPGGPDLPLQGGTVARFLDRKAALLVYKRREHRVSLFVVRPEGLDWPAGARRWALELRGFHLLVWRTGDLGYALVSDLEAGELDHLAEQFQAAQ